ncbi:broad substrate specificity ATP-binding cassette transporter ABCG2-like [Carassius carassius]|uniref:broad substrate specificity ATP-binding cassette transporter ABCG2-like n=1 Tax=Carassius carassius TaxID=217509 RepID=UPI002868688A|nr:broad substrate specificity ATP-binding cassette transporter ABCG2-like [Carassius carassius]XP_059384537.1 broad substrate specificity ATP-binding cassette transporter ABCG2-like [Carassius carassius]
MADTAVQMTGDLNNNVSRAPVSTRMSFLSPRRGATMSFHNINYSVKMKSGFMFKRKVTQKNILIELNGIMKPGLNAILGPTGSGKSSFLDVLAARKDPAGLSGEVLIDGAPQPPNFKCLSGYVVQDDVVMGTLTVRENLRFSAALRLPKSIRQREKDEKIERLIQELGLTKVADSRVGTQLIRGVSGGERKRTSIGMELIFDPPVLFLDEPTTGLDASTANSVLMLLKRMANSSRTIILSIHQPRYSIYRLFDSLTLLLGGRLVYHGPAQEALDYFSQIGYICEPHNNPADFFLDVINGESTAVALNKLYDDEELDQEQLRSSLKGIEDRLVEEYKNSASNKQTKSELEQIVQGQDYSKQLKSRTITYRTSFCHQFNWVLKRTFKDLMLNPQTSLVQIGVMIFMALVVGAIFFGVKDNMNGIQNRMGALFFITSNQCFTSMSSAELFITERKLFVHEYISGYYRVSVYFLSKVLSDILTLRTIPSIIFSCVVYWMIGLKATAEAFFIFLFSIILVSYTATSMTLAISADQTVVGIATTVINMIFVFMMIFSGLLVNLPSVADWLNWLKYLSIPRYGLVAVEINEFIGLSLCDMRNTSGLEIQVCTTGEDFLSEQGIDYSTWGLWQNHLALGIMTLIFFIIAYLKLRLIKKFT